MGFRYSGTNWAGIRWRTVGGITTLGQQIEQLRPGTHPADGTVASKRHDQTNPASDHSPDNNGDVRAIDIGHNQFTTLGDWAEHIRLSRDDRVKYVILGNVMYSSYSKGFIEAWTWRPYSGGYHQHMHVSLVTNGRCESTRPWLLEEDPMAHTHTPMPDELPRQWADQAWQQWVQVSGTGDNTRTWDFYREDLAWVYDRVIKPLEARVADLERTVDQLTESPGGLVLPANVQISEIP